MNARRKVPYGVGNYEKLIRECCFVDNTAYIRELENVDTPVFMRPKRFGKSLWCSVDELFSDYGFDPANKSTVFRDLKAFYDGHRFVPGSEPLCNSTICNWYLRCLVANGGVPPSQVIDTNVRTDVGWIRRLAGGSANALDRVRAYVERGEGESASQSSLAAKFGRAKFFSEEFFPYALYYLEVETAVVEVYSNLGYRWFPVP